MKENKTNEKAEKKEANAEESEEIMPMKVQKKEVLALPAPSEASTSVGCSTPPSTNRFNPPTPSSTYDRFEAEAAQKGQSVEDYMMELSQESLTAAVEAKMNSIVAKANMEEDQGATGQATMEEDQLESEVEGEEEEAGAEEEEEEEEVEDDEGQENEDQGSVQTNSDDSASEDSTESSSEDKQEDADKIVEALLEDDESQDSKESEEEEEEEDEGEVEPTKKASLEDPKSTTPQAALALKDAVEKQEEIRAEFASANSN